MPRKRRELIAGGVYHVYARGNNRRLIYEDDRDRLKYLALLGEVVGREGWRCLSYCLMDNHVHLLVETPQPNLDVGMRRLHGDYARIFNKRHTRSGHVFQGRYGAEPLKREAHLFAAAAYIAANPVDAGLCADPHAWPWGSHSVAGTAAEPPWLDTARLLALYEALGGDAHQRYASSVDERARRARPLAVSATACAPNRSQSSPVPAPPSSCKTSRSPVPLTR